jgi:hypothetical protein
MNFSIKLATSIGLLFFPRRSDENNTWQGIRPTKVLQTIKFSLWVDRDNFRVWGVRSLGGSFLTVFKPRPTFYTIMG